MNEYEYQRIKERIENLTRIATQNERPISGNPNTKTYKKRQRRQGQIGEFITALTHRNMGDIPITELFKFEAEKKARLETLGISLDKTIIPLLAEVGIMEEEMIEIALEPVTTAQKMARERRQDVLEVLPDFRAEGLTSEDLTIWAMVRIKKIRHAHNLVFAQEVNVGNE